MKLFRRLLTFTLALEALGTVVAAYAAADQQTQLIGFMKRDDSWLDVLEPQAEFGFYQFQADGQGGIRAISPTGPDNQWALNGGTYANGKYYCYSIGEDDGWKRFTLTYRVIDAVTWKSDVVRSYAYPWKGDEPMPGFLETSQIPSAIVYDAIGDKFYAFTHRIDSDGDTNFMSVDPETGMLTKISGSRYVSGAACDSQGNILAIDMGGNLGRIEKDGTWVQIGHTGFYPTRDSAIALGAACDYRSGKFYWSFYGFANETDRNYNTNPVFALLEIDPATAESKISYSYPINNQFSALTIQNSHPTAPDNILDLAIRPEKALSDNGVISFTVPTLTYAQQPLTGNVTLSVALDGEPFPSETLAPGAKYEKKVSGLSRGNHTVTAYLEANGHMTSQAFDTYFFGNDVPAAVTNLTLKYNDNTHEATLTWDVPETGKNGGTVDVNDVRYRIVRYPDVKTVARSAKGTSFVDKANVSFGAYYYRVYPYYSSDPSIEGSYARSNSELMGDPVTLPWEETFDTSSSLNNFTLIDANGDGSSEWNSPCWKYDDAFYCAFYYGNRGVTADDWLVTPSLKMTKDKLYKLTYKYYAYYGYGSHLQVAIGQKPTVESLNTIILDRQFTSTQSDYPGITETIIFCPTNDETFIGFHHISETMEHLSIDDIKVEEYASADVPAAVADLTATNSGMGQATIFFTVPDKTAGAQPLTGSLSAKIFKGDDLTEPAETLTGLKAGEKASWTDNYAAPGVNIYTVVICNSKGDGLTASTSIDLTAGIPLQLKQVNARLINSNQVEVSWNPQDVAFDGNGDPLDPASIRYLVYKPMWDVDGVYPMLVGRDLDTNIFIDNDPFAGLTEELQVLNYYVAAVNAASEGDAQVSNGVFIGTPYSLPFSETWKEQIYSTNPWTYTVRNGATWYPRAKGYDPIVDGQDGWGLMDCEADYERESGIAGLGTPRIDFTTMRDPILKYWLYRSPSYDEEVQMAIYIDNNGRLTPVADGVTSAKSDTEGWYEVVVPLSEYNNLTSASITFLATAKAEQTIHLDNISITGTKVANEVRLVEFKTPNDCRVGEEVKFSARVDNVGSSNLSDIKVTLKVNNQAVANASVASLASGKDAVVTLAWTPEEAGDYATECVIEAAGDSEVSNNTMKGLYTVKPSVEPYVNSISGQILEEGVKVTWKVPSCADATETVVDDVELYDAFTIEDAGAWTLRDGDGLYTFNFSDGQGGVLSWPNFQELQSFIVFNPSKVEAATFPFTPHSGNQAFVSWAAAGGQNNDWLISPELPGNSQLISFVARSAISGNEPFKVFYSTEGTEIEDFHSVSGDVPRYTDTEWRLFHYLLPEGTKHFAINYVGRNGMGIVIDDLLYFGAPVSAKPDGYNIYRDNKKLNSSLLTERQFIDVDAEEPGTYRYRVAAVYNGVESRLSDEFVYTHSGLNDYSADSVKVSTEKGKIVILGAAGLNVNIASASGQTILLAEGQPEMEIPAETGVYVVRVGQKTFKVIVK